MTPLDQMIDPAARYPDDRLFYTWSADAQKLYAWLRRKACRGEGDAPPEARLWHARGFIATYATAEQLMAQAIPISKNTLTKLIAELRQLNVCHPRNVGRGYVFLLGEWHLRQSEETGCTLAFEAFYLDAMLRASDLSHILGGNGQPADSNTPARPAL